METGQMQKIVLIKKNPPRPIPQVGSASDVIIEIERYVEEIEQEVRFIKMKSTAKSYTLSDGTFIYAEGKNGYYQFPNHQFLNFAQDTGAVFTVNTLTRPGFISFCSHEYIEVCIQNFTEPIDSLSMKVDASRLVKALADRVGELDTNNAMLRMLVDGGRRNRTIEGNPETGFESVKKKVENGFISIVWGPPGTGKTYTLANLALEYMKKGKRVLIMSQSNISVDGAVLKIIDIAKQTDTLDSIKGRVFRYGMAREPGLYANEDFCARLYARNRNPEIKMILEETDHVLQLPDEYASVVEGEKRLLSLSSKLMRNQLLDKDAKERLKEIQDTLKSKECPFWWMKRVAQELRAFCHAVLVQEEESYIKKASIIATTATKATITDKIRELKWDIVFFDEVSMAYVPQIMIASTLARERLVLLGDFRQLAPIVQHSSTSVLRNDIFKYLSITDGKGGVSNHPWLTLLDEQRRMHPDIATFVSSNLYDGRIKTPIEVEARVRPVTDRSPFAGKAMAMVDHSSLQALCYTTRFGSRYNPLSAIISLKIALNALESTSLSIGIITPYQAQARLLSAMVKDAEASMSRKLDVVCSTVHQFQGFEKDLIIFDTVESEPKKETGKLFVDGETIDDATRLVNVAITRARSKFIVVANQSFLNDHRNDISPEMRKLLELARSQSVLSGNGLLDFIAKMDACDSVMCFRSDADAAPVMVKTVSDGDPKKKLTYWHSSRNKLKGSSSFMPKEFTDLMKNAKTRWKSVGACNGSGSNPTVLSKIVFPTFNPKDDYLVGEDSFVWFCMPYASNNNYGRRIPYLIRGRNAASVFEMLCDHEFARKQIQTQKKNSQMSTSGFSQYLSTKFSCPKCNCGSTVKKTTTNGKYIVVCPKCGGTLNPYVPFKTIEEYMVKEKIRCFECGADLKIGRFGKPRCIRDWSHTCGVTLDDVFTK